MKRFLKIAVPVFVLGFGLGMAFWYLASPLWIDRVVNETLAETDTAEILATGSFDGVDRVHQAMGDVTLLRQMDGQVVLQFAGFEVTNGPDLKVWMVSHDSPQDGSDVKKSEQLRLSPLKGNIGDQAYTLPAGTDVAAFKSVVIYCQQFGILFASAPLS